MRRVLVCLLVACGSRTDLSGPPVVASTACTDALEPGAFKPVANYCSDNANRAPTTAPQYPHVVWTKQVADAEAGLLVSPMGTAFFAESPANVHAVTLVGEELWTHALSGPLMSGFLLPGRVANVRWATPGLVTLAQDTGAETSMLWPKYGTNIRAAADGSFFVELIEISGIQSFFVGIARAEPDGTAQWTEKGDCDPGGDFPAPHDFVRRNDHLVIVCNAKSGGVEVLEVDANDHEVWDGRVDGSLIDTLYRPSGVALAPNGDLVFFVTFDPSTNASSLVTIGPDGKSSELGGPTLPSPRLRAVAADGTLVVSTNDDLTAVSNRAIRWQTPLASTAHVFVDSDHTIVAATNGSITGVELSSGATIWQLALPTNDDVVEIAAAGPGEVYVLTSSSLTLISD